MILFSRSWGVSFFTTGVCLEDPPAELPAFESFASAEEVLQVLKKCIKVSVGYYKS